MRVPIGEVGARRAVPGNKQLEPHPMTLSNFQTLHPEALKNWFLVQENPILNASLHFPRTNSQHRYPSPIIIQQRRQRRASDSYRILITRILSDNKRRSRLRFSSVKKP